MLKKLSYWLIILLSYSNIVLADQTFSSGKQKIPLIELYTSEGCSSCPPADRWISKLTTKDLLWKKYVPIAFHVDYWDYIGWQDPFADPSHTIRQRQYRQQGNTKGVYTPGVLLMGQEWQTWYLNKDIPVVDWSNVGDLQVNIEGKVAKIIFKPTENLSNNLSDKLKINFSVLGFDLISDVSRGENRGKKLIHNFVNLARVRKLSTLNNGEYSWEVDIPSKLKSNAPKLGYAVWVSGENTLQPIQSVGAWKN